MAAGAVMWMHEAQFGGWVFFAGLAAVAWAVYGSRLPPADFTFVNETEVASVDPAPINAAMAAAQAGLAKAEAELDRAEDLADRDNDRDDDSDDE